MLGKVVILDNGHGNDTPGKRSPDGKFFEYKWTRMFVQRLKKELTEIGYSVYVVVPEQEDIPLSVRAKRVNDIVNKYGAKNCIMLSIHNNAASNGTWSNATGFECWTTEGDNNSDRLAECLCNACEDIGIKLRKDMSDGDKDKEKNFTIIYKAACPSVLIENMFMDSKEDVKFLTSEEGIEKLLNLHIIGIQRYFGAPVSAIKR